MFNISNGAVFCYLYCLLFSLQLPTQCSVMFAIAHTVFCYVYSVHIVFGYEYSCPHYVLL